MHAGTVDLGLIDAMNAAQRYRGPDSQRSWVAGRIGLGVGRLAITGSVAAGTQPFVRGRQVLIYNGEIYNYADLSAAGPAAGQCDGTALLDVIERCGLAGLRQVRGMFAAAIWDAEQERLTLVRDAIGKKPLYYANCPNGVAFASTIAALRVAVGELRIRYGAVAESLIYKSVGGYESAFEGIGQVAAGGYVDFGPDGSRAGLWWEPPAGRGQGGSEAELRGVLDEAIRLRSVYSGDIAVFLSGGLDSSIVATRTAESVARDRLVLFSVGYGLAEAELSADERPLARRVAAGLGHPLREVTLVPAQVPALLPQVARILEDPIHDPITLSTFVLARAARELTRVVLTGDGADEVWSGYERFTDLESYEQYLERVRLFSPGELGLPIAPASYHAIDAAVDPAHLTADIASNEFRNRLRNYHLPRIDKLLMANQIEARSPFLDLRVVEYGLSLGTAAKRRGTTSKALLANAYADTLPGWLLRRKKQPFTLPVYAWLSTALRTYAHDVLLDPGAFVAAFVPRPAIRALLALTSASDAQKVWALLGLEAWHAAMVRGHAEPRYEKLAV